MDLSQILGIQVANSTLLATNSSTEHHFVDINGEFHVTEWRAYFTVGGRLFCAMKTEKYRITDDGEHPISAEKTVNRVEEDGQRFLAGEKRACCIVEGTLHVKVETRKYQVVEGRPQLYFKRRLYRIEEGRWRDPTLERTDYRLEGTRPW